MPEVLSFADALEATKSGSRAILLGNGFSIAQAGGQFAYSSLLEQSGLEADGALRKVFEV